MKKSKTNEHRAGCNIASIATCSSNSAGYPSVIRSTKSAEHSSNICSTKSLQPSAILCGTIFTLTLCLGAILSSHIVSAEGGNTNTDIVDQINITVPVSCTMSGTGMNTHNAEIANGTYTPNIGTTTLHAFCNDNEGFAIYATGYTGNVIGETNSNKLVGTSASSNSAIESGIATSAGNPDISNWAMKLTATQDSGDITGTNAFTIDSAPNVALPSEAEQGATSTSFSNYHMVPNEYTKVAHKNSLTDMTANTGGVKLTTTYAAYISKTQPADTYSGQVIYTLVHPSNAPEPVPEGKVGVTYHANGSTFIGGADTNRVIYASSPMYIAAIPTVVETSNLTNGNQSGSYASDEHVLETKSFTGASKLKLVVDYGLTDEAGITVAEGAWGGWDDDDVPTGTYYSINTWDEGDNIAGSKTYIINNDTVTIEMNAYNAPQGNTNYDYGMYARIYPIYITEQSGTEPSVEFATLSVDKGTYVQTTDWYGSWYADINGEHHDFTDESELMTFLGENNSTFSGTNIDLYRGLTFTEAYTRANKTQDGGYYKQQELTRSMCNTIAVTQNQIVKDVRDNTTYMIGKLKDGNCWMLDNLALDPTDATTAANMNASNTNATAEAITNYLNGGSSNTGWSNTAVANVTSGFDSYTAPMINDASKDTLVTSYGSASTNGQAKVGLYYNYCAATVGTYCYTGGQGIDKPDTLIDADQDICPANWRMPTGGSTGEYQSLAGKYTSTTATDSSSLQYNLSTPLSGSFYGSSAFSQGYDGYFWSSTFKEGYCMYGLSVIPSHTFILVAGRNDGNSIRCLVGD